MPIQFKSNAQKRWSDSGPVSSLDISLDTLCFELQRFEMNNLGFNRILVTRFKLEDQELNWVGLDFFRIGLVRIDIFIWVQNWIRVWQISRVRSSIRIQTNVVSKTRVEWKKYSSCFEKIFVLCCLSEISNFRIFEFLPNSADSQTCLFLFFPDTQLSHLITDLFLAGSETTFSTLRWAILYMAAYPDVQEKVHQELVAVVGANRLPSMGDKKNTPYTEAVLSEVQRVNTLLPFGLFHTNLSSDFQISGYTIPRGTAVVANLHAAHRDPAVWKRPDDFDPNHFLDDNGKVTNLDRLIPFSIGKTSLSQLGSESLNPLLIPSLRQIARKQIWKR